MQVKPKPHLHASWIDPFAKDIVQHLQKGGFTSYLVGGCVRDLLAGIHPKDYDIATNASPQQVKKRVYGAYIIGRRFRLVLVKRGDQQYEVATFRREATAEDMAKLNEEAEAADELPASGDNFFGTPEEDALRRDFTINALFYDPVKDELLDFANGMADMDARTLRMIGDPTKRIIEDPIRTLRAIRLSHKLKFKIEDSLREAITQNTDALKLALLPRKREEYLKFLRLPDPGLAFIELYDLGLMKILLPTLDDVFSKPEQREVFLHYLARWSELVWDLSNPVEIYTTLLWALSISLGEMKDFEEKADRFMKDELGVFKAEALAVESVFQLQNRLRDIEGFKKRGARRQQGFLKHDGLSLALRLAKAEHLLSPADFAFWDLLIHPPKRDPVEPTKNLG
jgi:poly(A) polymerase